jgi:hypothetical protein
MRIERHDRAERCSHSERTLDVEVAAERAEPIDKAAHPDPDAGLAPQTPSSRTLTSAWS